MKTLKTKNGILTFLSFGTPANTGVVFVGALFFAFLLTSCSRRAPLDGQCLQLYQRMYGDTPHLKVSVFFGYKDSRPARLVGDRYEAAVLSDWLRSNGWKKLGSDLPLKFEKWVDLPAPLNPRKRTIELEIWPSAIGADDGVNRKDPFQKAWSARVESEWHTALTKSDWVIYDGHSRDGGGPDFGIPQLTRDEHVEYTVYERDQKQIRATLATLKAEAPGGQAPKLLGIYSCSSSQLFRDSVREVSKKTVLVTSRKLLYWTDALGAIATHLGAWTEARCPSPGSDQKLDLTFGTGTELSIF